jgi:excisionase family DNA binding protein
VNEQPNPLPKVAYRVDEAARLLNVHPSTIYELVRAGQMVHIVPDMSRTLFRLWIINPSQMHRQA